MIQGFTPFSNPQKQASKRAFSLIELLVVIFLISLVYFFVIANVKIANKNKKPVLTPLTLRDIAKDQLGKSGEIICIADCKQCYISKNHASLDPYKGNINFGNDVVVYTMRQGDNLEKEDFGRIDDNKVCLRFNLYSNKSSSKMVIQNDKGFFYIPSYFDEPQKVATLQEAEELWLQYNRIVSSGGDFY